MNIEIEVIKRLIDKHFVCGYEQGLSGAVHSSHCRKCALLKEIEDIERNDKK